MSIDFGGVYEACHPLVCSGKYVVAVFHDDQADGLVLVVVVFDQVTAAELVCHSQHFAQL